ncbi:FAD-dependent oxidoreductase [Nonomuraea sp. NPDC046802]|uniref:NAD(P)/FAD-dependent oxidoreductase n=1 Tax=Nonomuraea sp. NPDC046802 TaxID=3154919 RepID=UPI0033F8B748
MNRIVIVGASAGGLSTAEALRRAGHEGAITLVGDEPHLPYDRPPLSKQLLSGQWEPDRLALRRPADIDALGLDLRLGASATGLDLTEKVVTLADGARLPYDGLVIATGVRPRRLPGRTGVAGLHVLRTLQDAMSLRAGLRPGRRLVIVGAGFVGAEVAATAHGLGAEVTVLEAGPVPLAEAVGEEAGRFVARLHDARGVRIRTATAVAQILAVRDRVSGVLLADGEVVPADDVLVAIGSTPNTEWLSGSGLTVADGLLCDEHCAAAPGVFAAGDVARWHNPLFGAAMRIEHRTHAAEQALAVARNLLDPDRQRPFAPVPYFWSDQYDTKIQAYGQLRDHDEALVLDADAARPRLLVAYRRAGRLTGVLAAGVPPKTLRAWRALIAAGAEWSAAVAEASQEYA